MLSALQKQMDLRVDATAIPEERHKGQQGKLDEAEKSWRSRKRALTGCAETR